MPGMRNSGCTETREADGYYSANNGRTENVPWVVPTHKHP